MRELARNKETGYLFPNRDNLSSAKFEVVRVPDSFRGERLDDYGNIIGYNDSPRDNTSDAEIVEEVLAPVPVSKKKVAKKVAKKKAAVKKEIPAHDDLFGGID